MDRCSHISANFHCYLCCAWMETMRNTISRNCSNKLWLSLMQGLLKMIVGPSCCRNSCVFLWKLRKLETGIKLFGKWSTIWTPEMVHHCTCLVFSSSDRQAQIHPIVNDERRKLWLMFTHLLPFVKLSLHTYQNYWQTHYLWRIWGTYVWRICASTTTNLAGIMHCWFFRFFI